MAIRPEMLVEKFYQNNDDALVKPIVFFENAGYSKDEIIDMFKDNKELRVRHEGNTYTVKLIDGETIGVILSVFTDVNFYREGLSRAGLKLKKKEKPAKKNNY